MLRSHASSGAAHACLPAGLIDLENREPWKNLNKSAFEFRHNLRGHPLFSIERLAKLSERVFDWPDYQRYFGLDERSLPKPELKRRLHDRILDVANNGRWLSLHHVDEVAPEYAQLLDQLFADIEHLIGQPIRSQMAWGSMSIFMNAPALSVPYHFDHDINFLMQIEGERFQFLHEALVGGDEKNYFQLTPDEQARLDKQQGKFGYALDALEDAAERAATYIHPKMGPYDPNADRQTKLMIEGGLPDLQVEDAPPAPSVAKKEG